VNSEKLKTKSFGIWGNASRYARIAFCFSLFTIHFSLFTAASAQDDEPAPPPLKLLTKEDRKRLDSIADPKDRTKLVVDMMRSRIDAAEKRNTANDFDGIFRELGYFRGLVEYSLEFLGKQDTNENRALDNYKRLELSLRAVLPRIEAIRRELPLRYEGYVRDLATFIREARNKAIEPLFDDTVLPTGGKSSEK